MINFYTSRYSNPELKRGAYFAVRISSGHPRFALGYPIMLSIAELAPSEALRKIEDESEFKKLYFEQLNGYDIVSVLERLCKVVPVQCDVVFLCFEDIRKEGVWCHRRIFAEWYEFAIGEKIPELHDPSEIKYSVTEKKAMREKATGPLLF